MSQIPSSHDKDDKQINRDTFSNISMFISMKIDDWIKKKDFLSSVQSFSIFKEEFYMLGPILLT